MYCPKCGEQNDDENKYCSKCGAELKLRSNMSTLPLSTEKSSNTPIALIAIMWVIIVLGFIIPNFDFAFGVFYSLGALILTIVLLANRSSTAKINGGIGLAIWLIQNLYAYVATVI